MGQKTAKPLKDTPAEDTSEKFYVNEVEGAKSNTGMRTKFQYQREMANQKQNVEKNMLDTILRESVSDEDIRNLYIFDKKKLGRGHFGSVRRAKFICDSKRNYCVKSIVVSNLLGDMYLLKRELEILRLMDHPNIVRFFDIYEKDDEVQKFNKKENQSVSESTKYLHLVMEHCSGGDLLTKLLRETRFEEDYARVLMFQIAYAVNHLHHQGICHRDLRLENFILLDKSHQNVVKLVDFGLAKMFSSSELKTKVGAYHYVAPEIFSGSYTPEVDAWSLGVMLYMMLTGEPPFHSANPESIYSSIKSGGYSTSQPVWNSVSPAAKDLVKDLLEVDFAKRLKVEDVLQHAWFSPIHLEYRDIGKLYLKKDLLERFKSFKKMSVFQKEVVKLMIMIFYDHEEIDRLRYVFYYLDQKQAGVLDVHQLKMFFNDYGEAVSEADFEDILKELNLKFKNSVTLTEFIAVTVEPFFIRDEKNIMAVYNRIRAQVPTILPQLGDSKSRLHNQSHSKPDMTNDDQKNKLKRPPELTGQVLRNSMNKFGLKIPMEDFSRMLNELRKETNEHKNSVETIFYYWEFEAAMKRIYN
jgi:calcium-dependent protein kinase